MSRARVDTLARRRMAGLSLIELMVALVLALIVAAGIISVFASTSSSNKVQVQMATLQEEGRFAIHNLGTDLANANGAYCSNSGGATSPSGSGLVLDSLRSPIVYAKTPIVLPDNTVAIATPTQPYVLPSNVFMRGYDCSVGSCDPVDPDTALPAGIPQMGTAVGERVVGAAVLTMRYLRPNSGWAIVPSGSGAGSTINASGSGPSGGLTITLNPLPGEESANVFQSGDLALLATCSNAGIYNMTAGSGQLVATSDNYTQPTDISEGNQAAPRVFDFTRDFQTVTYYLKVACTNGNATLGSGCPAPYHTIGELERRVNGVDQPLVVGVERLDFQYGIIGADGTTRYLTAAQVDDQDGGGIACPPQMPPLDSVTPDPASGCLWRAIQTIDVHVLMDGQTPLYTLTPAELNYIYSPDGDALEAPELHAVRPKADQGFPDHLLRREFTTVVALRNFNP